MRDWENQSYTSCLKLVTCTNGMDTFSHDLYFSSVNDFKRFQLIAIPLAGNAHLSPIANYFQFSL